MKFNVKEFVAEKAASWVIEIVILAIVATVTISEVRKTNEQTREMLTAVSSFAAQYQGQAGEAVENVLHEVATVEVEGSIDAGGLGDAAKDAVSGFFGKKEEAANDTRCETMANEVVRKSDSVRPNSNSGNETLYHIVYAECRKAAD